MREILRDHPDFVNQINYDEQGNNDFTPIEVYIFQLGSLYQAEERRDYGLSDPQIKNKYNLSKHWIKFCGHSVVSLTTWYFS